MGKSIIYMCIFSLFGIALLSQEKISISGQVVDDSGYPLIGANVILKGSTEGTITDIDGKFQLSVPDSSAVLVVSYTGYLIKEVSCGDVNGSFIQLEMGQMLEEIVVTGYNGKAKQSIGHSLHYESGLTRESYQKIEENKRKFTKEDHTSTFSIDVDNAAYSNLRRMINHHQQIPKDAVRIEEMVNYFKYEFKPPSDDLPFAVSSELGINPWNPDEQLLMIGIKGKDIPFENIPPQNVVFLIDVSGSMNNMNKLPLLKSSFEMLIDKFRPQDHVSIVVYAGAAGLVLPPTSGDQKMTIKSALGKLKAGGSTAGAQGIKLAYETAMKYFKKDGNNRVVLATDGDFNVGISSDKELEKLILAYRNKGVFLSCLGFGMGNYKDSKLQVLAEKGNGNHSYIDNINEARKVLVEEFGSTFFTIAKDVKLQLNFNQDIVKSYRLVGYESRILDDEEFADDKKDAGEIGAGHSIVALYEINLNNEGDSFHELPLASLDIRYKSPIGMKSILNSYSIPTEIKSTQETSNDFRFASAVAYFGLILRESEHVKTKYNVEDIAGLAIYAKGRDYYGYREEFVNLVRKKLSGIE